MAVKKVFVVDDVSLRDDLKYVKDAAAKEDPKHTRVPPLSTRKFQAEHPNYFRDKIPMYEFIKMHNL